VGVLKMVKLLKLAAVISDIMGHNNNNQQQQQQTNDKQQQ